MVIQNACPRFSVRTLLSVMALLARLLVSANISSSRTSDHKKESGGRNRRRDLPDPDLVVMERGTAYRRNRFGAGQHVDAATADMGLVRVYGFGDQHATSHALEQFCDQAGLAARVAEGDRVTIGD